MKESGNISKSQYPGTKKKSWCTICRQELNHLSRVEQDLHAEKCLKESIEQKKLI